MRAALAVLPVLMLYPAVAAAADLGAQPSVVNAAPASAGFGFLSEARIGAFAHDPWSPERGGGADLNLELLSVRPIQASDPAWQWAVPRFQVGGTINFAGRTSHAYAGLAWTIDMTPSLFVEASIGGAVHNGETNAISGSHHSALGCGALFRESASLGYRITPQWSVMATIEHLSNAGLCSNNRGLTNSGLRLAYTF